ncbi:MAG TPA: ADP-ribosylglycohydrolase family protein [Longimicrobiales bacterium]|nr:ADP-ribosylglycohydrolase family protein [Longimicrobiales bacterium]
MHERLYAPTLLVPQGWPAPSGIGSHSGGRNSVLALRERVRGALVGLAVGDALGTTNEFLPPGSFPPLTDMVGGGCFGLAPGQWTDDTSMALCLAESLIERREFDPADQLERYLRWMHDGHLSSTGRCFDIGDTTRSALFRYETAKSIYADGSDRSRAANGSLMRLAPVPARYWSEPRSAIHLSGESSRTTHGSPLPVDACRYMAAIIVGAIRGASREELLSPFFTPVPGLWEAHPLEPEIAEIAAGSFRRKQPPAIRGSGYCVHALEAALWAFHSSDDFRSGALLAVNLGEDADTTGAIYGQIAGAYYGESAIPVEWRRKLALRQTIDRFAEMLFQLSVHPGHAPAPEQTVQAREELERSLAVYGSPAAAIAAMEGVRRSDQSAARPRGEPASGLTADAELLMLLRVELGLRLIE